MSGVQSEIDLAGLARPEPSLSPPRRSAARWLLPLVILVVFLAVLGSSLGELFATAVDVRVVRPRAALHGESSGPGGLGEGGPQRVVLQAAGWVEPDPFPTSITALTPGVVASVLVQESDVVEAGAPVATLVDDDARLAVDGARAALARARASAAEAEARSAIAAERFEAALEVQEAHEVARSTEAARRAEATHRAAAVAQGEARVAIAEDEVVVQRELEESGVGGLRQLEIAEARHAEELAGLEILRADAAAASAEAEVAAARLARARRDVELRFEDRLERDTSAAAAEVARAEVEAARVALAEAELRLERTTVVAPTAGVVLERRVAPGDVLAGDGAGDVVATLFDPASVRVRVDVPQGDVALVRAGQRAEVLSESRAGQPYRGRVLRVVQRADIQKVTLQVHVRVEDGDLLLRPEMLCQVRFLGGGEAPGAGASGGTSAGESLFVPARLVEGGAVWVLDASEPRARRRALELGARVGEEVEVLGGLNLSDKLIDAGGRALEDGTRVRVRGD